MWAEGPVCGLRFLCLWWPRDQEACSQLRTSPQGKSYWVGVGKIDFLGRDFEEDCRDGKTTVSYRLSRWQNSLVGIIQDKVLKGQLDEEAAGRCAQQITSFRHENRFNPEELQKLERAIVEFELELLGQFSRALKPIESFEGNIDNHTCHLSCNWWGPPPLRDLCSWRTRVSDLLSRGDRPDTTPSKKEGLIKIY